MEVVANLVLVLELQKVAHGALEAYLLDLERHVSVLFGKMDLEVTLHRGCGVAKVAKQSEPHDVVFGILSFAVLVLFVILSLLFWAKL